MTRYQLRYSEPMIRSGIRTYWRHRIGLAFPLVTLFLGADLAWLLANGNRSWLVGVIATVIVLACATMGATYVVHLRRSLKRLRRMRTPQATLEMRDETFRISSDLGAAEIHWAMLEDAWRLKDAWLLSSGPGDMMFLPIGDLPEAGRIRIEERLRTHEVRLHGRTRSTSGKH